MSLRSQVDSLALNKALNPNVNFPPVCLRVVLPPPLPYGFPLPLGRLSLSTTFLRLQRGWCSWLYTPPIQEWGRQADYISPAFLPMDGTKLEKFRGLSQIQVSSFLVQSNSWHHENPIWALGDCLDSPSFCCFVEIRKAKMVLSRSIL